MSIEQLLWLGNYNSYSDQITGEHFPTTRTGKAETEIVLIPFNRDTHYTIALKEINKRGYRPAEAHEVLALGAQYPNIQRESSVIALGSIWEDSRSLWSVCLHGYSKDVIIAMPSGLWFSKWYCAAVRK